MSTRAKAGAGRRKFFPIWRADLALASIALVWGLTFIVVKRALSDISILYFLALRFAFATLCMLLMFLPAFRRAERTAVWRGLRAGGTAGVFLWLGYALQTLGLKFTSAGNSGFITGLYVVLVPLFSAAIYRRWPKKPELTGIAIASAGMLVLTLPGLDRKLGMNTGDALTIACAVAFAFHLLAIGYFSQRERFEAVALGQVACTAFLSVLGLLFEHPRAAWNTGVVFAILLTGLFATALAFALQTWAQQYTTPTRTALIFALEPVFALAAAVLIGGERLTIYSLVGGSMILSGILVVELRPAQQALETAPDSGAE